VLVVAGLRLAQALLVPLMFAAFLSTLTAPAVIWLHRRRVTPALSVPLVVLLLVGIILGFVGVLIGTGQAFVLAYPRYSARVADLLGSTVAWLGQHGVLIDRSLLRGTVGSDTVVGLLNAALAGLTNTVSYTLLVILTMVFMLLEVTGLARKLRAAIGDPQADLGRFTKVTHEIKDYIVIKTGTSLATGVLVWALLRLVGVDFALLWGVLAFICNYIPTIGGFIAGAPAVLIGLVQYGPGACAIVLGGYVAINLAILNLETHLMGRRLHLSTLVVFLSMVGWGWLWGAAGMLLSVPLTMALKIALENDEDWRWVAVLMDPAPRDDDPA
jgi:predicted PurR-regulated permease PerM